MLTWASMFKQNKRNQALIKAVEMAARIDPSLFHAEWPIRCCSVLPCSRELGHSGPHVTTHKRYFDDSYKMVGKPWFTTTKVNKAKRKVKQ